MWAWKVLAFNPSSLAPSVHSLSEAVCQSAQPPWSPPPQGRRASDHPNISMVTTALDSTYPERRKINKSTLQPMYTNKRWWLGGKHGNKSCHGEKRLPKQGPKAARQTSPRTASVIEAHCHLWNFIVSLRVWDICYVSCPRDVHVITGQSPHHSQACVRASNIFMVSYCLVLIPFSQSHNLCPWAVPHNPGLTIQDLTSVQT